MTNIYYIYSPRELNFVKNVVLLKFSNGNINIAKNPGTVLRKSHAGPNASNVFSYITTVSLAWVSFVEHKTVIIKAIKSILRKKVFYSRIIN